MGARPLRRTTLARVAAQDRPLGIRGLAGATVGVAAGATVLYGLAWPLAIFPLVGNAALETSYAIPHRLEQLGLPDELALAVGITALVVGLAVLARGAARGHARLGLAACLVLVTTPYLAVWYLAWAVPVVAAEEDATATVVVLALLRIPVAADDSDLSGYGAAVLCSTTTPSSARTTRQPASCRNRA